MPQLSFVKNIITIIWKITIITKFHYAVNVLIVSVEEIIMYCLIR